MPFSSYLTLNNIVTLKSGLEVTQGHWNWCHSKACAVSYSPSIVTETISYIVCEIQRLIGRKSGNFYTAHVFSAPSGGAKYRCGISWRCLMLVKLELLGYRKVKKLWRYVKPFSSNTGTLRTDGQNCYINMRICVLTRDKNHRSLIQICIMHHPVSEINSLIHSVSLAQSRLDSPLHSLVSSSLLSSPLSLSITPSLFHSSLQAQNLPFQQILPTLDFFYLPDCFHDNGTGPDLSYSLFYF